MDITTIIYRGVGHGDWVDCHNCERTMLVPCGAEVCPECYASALGFHSLEHQEIDAEDIPNAKHVDRTLTVDDCDKEVIFQRLVDKYGCSTIRSMAENSLSPLFRRLKRYQLGKLFDIISACQNKYDFIDYDEDEEEFEDIEDCPTVVIQTIYHDYYNSLSMDVFVLSVRIINNELKLLVVDKACKMFEIDARNVALEYIQWLIDAIPQTND
jgi:hypothetical protein